MPPDADIRLVDTSVAVALVTQGHKDHEAVFEAVGSLRLGLSGHAAIETFSVLTRLPSPSRRSPAVVWRILSNNFAETRHLSSAGTEALLRLLKSTDVAGGAIYDALVAAAAVEHNLPLLTRDRRALDSYRAVGANVEWLA